MEEFKILYDKPTVEFATVANQYCLLLERTEKLQPKEFMRKISLILPLLYLKASLLEASSDEGMEEAEGFIDEFTYTRIREGIITTLKGKDHYLVYEPSDVHLVTEPRAASISEDLADMYQDIKNFLVSYELSSQEGMLSSLISCTENFKLYWGGKLLNALRALHQLEYETVVDDEIDSELPMQDYDWLNIDEQ